MLNQDNQQPSIPTPTTDFTRELACLITYTGKVAIAIRMYSSYGKSSNDKNDLDDLYWLSDSIHNLPELAGAILSKRWETVVTITEGLIRLYQGHKSKEVFEKHRDTFQIEEAVEIFHRIKTKASYF